MEIRERKAFLKLKKTQTPYARQKSALEKELIQFLSHLDRDITSATPDDVVSFLVWKDRFGKTVVHHDSCPYFGDKTKSACLCPRRLAFGTVDSVIGKLRAIFSQWGRSMDDSILPGYGNPAASSEVKSYLHSVRLEQLQARIVPSQAEPFFIHDLFLISTQILKNLSLSLGSPVQLFVLSRDQAFFKSLFFGGDRAADLCRVKTKEILYLPDKSGLLFNHTLTKSLRDGSSNMFAIKHYKDPLLCPVKAIETYVAMSDLLNVSVKDGFLFRPVDQSGDVLSGPFQASAAQARLNVYVKQLSHLFKDRRITLHGLRSGCSISLALSGANLQTIMDHVGWKLPSTAHHYLKFNNVMAPGGTSELLANLDIDVGECYRKRNDLFGFCTAFE